MATIPLDVRLRALAARCLARLARWVDPNKVEAETEDDSAARAKHEDKPVEHVLVGFLVFALLVGVSAWAGTSVKEGGVAIGLSTFTGLAMLAFTAALTWFGLRQLDALVKSVAEARRSADIAERALRVTHRPRVRVAWAEVGAYEESAAFMHARLENDGSTAAEMVNLVTDFQVAAMADGGGWRRLDARSFEDGHTHFVIALEPKADVTVPLLLPDWAPVYGDLVWFKITCLYIEELDKRTERTADFHFLGAVGKGTRTRVEPRTLAFDFPPDILEARERLRRRPATDHDPY